MSAPGPVDQPEVWTHRVTGQAFAVEHHCDTHGLPGWTKLRSLDTGHLYLTPYWQLCLYFDLQYAAPADDVMSLAHAVGVVAEQVRAPGQPHPSEFDTGPSGFGPAWADDALWADFDAAENGGAR